MQMLLKLSHEVRADRVSGQDSVKTPEAVRAGRQRRFTWKSSLATRDNYISIISYSLGPERLRRREQVKSILNVYFTGYQAVRHGLRSAVLAREWCHSKCWISGTVGNVLKHRSLLRFRFVEASNRARKYDAWLLDHKYDWCKCDCSQFLIMIQCV